MALTMPRSEERLGLIVAIAAHAGLLALLVLHPFKPPAVQPPERMSVTLSDETGLTSTSPQPQAEAAPDIAPVIAPVPAPQPEPLPAPIPGPAPVVKPAPKAAVVPKPQLRPAPRATPAPAPKAQPRPQATRQPVTRAPGGSRIGNDFLRGVPGAQATGAARNPPAAAIGPAVQSALSGAISRQLKPRWAAPQGAEAEKLVTILAWSLNADGTLAAGPQVVRQEGITDANRSQAARHAEQAIRAVRLAAPFDLPAEYYTAWKRIASFRFDKRLSQ